MSAGLLCPGQGAQTVGMGVSWTQQSPAAAEVFRRCSEALGFDLLELCATGPAERLVRTDVCQPAILATSAACLAALEEQGRVDRGRCSVALVEHSSGCHHVQRSNLGVELLEPHHDQV